MRKLRNSNQEDVALIGAPNYSWKTTLYHFVLLSSVVFCMVIIYKLCHLSYVGIPLANSLFQDIIKNWETKPIVDIRTDINPCSVEPGYFSLSNRWWDGTQSGCECQNLIKRDCTDLELNEGCSPVDPIEGRELYQFRGQQICARRGGQSFMEIERPDITGKCPPDSQVCGNSVSAPSELSCVAKSGKTLTISSDKDIKA